LNGAVGERRGSIHIRRLSAPAFDSSRIRFS